MQPETRIGTVLAEFGALIGLRCFPRRDHYRDRTGSTVPARFSLLFTMYISSRTSFRSFHFQTRFHDSGDTSFSERSWATPRDAFLDQWPSAGISRCHSRRDSTMGKPNLRQGRCGLPTWVQSGKIYVTSRESRTQVMCMSARSKLATELWVHLVEV